MRLYVLAVLIVCMMVVTTCQNPHKSKNITSRELVSNTNIKKDISQDDLVPDEKTAIAIAEAVLIPIYGKEQIEAEKPFHAKLNDNIWTVEGSLPEGWTGGVAMVQLSKRDARVSKIEHGL
jgi:hypothetical protein